MATVKDFRDLEIWKLANELKVKINEQLDPGDLAIDFSLKDQINSSAGSIRDNIAEGFKTGEKSEFVQFLGMARASASELQLQLTEWLNCDYINREIYDELYKLADKTEKKIEAFIIYLNEPGKSGDTFQDRVAYNEKPGTRHSIIKTETAARPLGAYPHARRVGDLLFLSGIGSRTAKDNSIPGLKLDDAGNILEYNIEAECHSVFANVKAVLEASGSSWDKIIDVTVFLTNMKEDFPVYNKIYGEYFKDVNACRTTVEVKSLPTPICIELKVIAII